MPTAWQKAMRGKPKARRAWAACSAPREIRPGTFEMDVDGGADGCFPVRLYADGVVSSGVRRFTPAEETKIRALFKRRP